MEHHTAIPYLHYRPRRKGASATRDERDSSTDPGRCQVHTEYSERHNNHQDQCGTEQLGYQCLQLHWTEDRHLHMGTDRSTRSDRSGCSSAATAALKYISHK